MNLFSPVTGLVRLLAEVPDEAFAGGLLGEGIAVEVEDGLESFEVLAPADGLLSVVAEAGHAFGMTLDDGVEILVHVGLDTVELDGDGFTRLQTEGARIAAGTPVLRVDALKVRAAGKTLTTPLVVCTPQEGMRLVASSGAAVQAGRNILLSY